MIPLFRFDVEEIQVNEQEVEFPGQLKLEVGSCKLLHEHTKLLHTPIILCHLLLGITAFLILPLYDLYFEIDYD